MPRDELEEFALAYELAAEEITGYWDGPVGLGYSEDDTEDLCKWIVSQGEALWLQAVSRERDLMDLAHLHELAQRGEGNEYKRWDVDLEHQRYYGWLSPSGLAGIIYETRFGSCLLERLDEMRVSDHAKISKPDG
jgi:hypothetical protein